VVLRERASHGLEFTFNDTYGKALTNSLGNYSLNVGGSASQGAFRTTRTAPQTGARLDTTFAIT
jgi:hypothetical protein